MQLAETTEILKRQVSFKAYCGEVLVTDSTTCAVAYGPYEKTMLGYGR